MLKTISLLIAATTLAGCASVGTDFVAPTPGAAVSARYRHGAQAGPAESAKDNTVHAALPAAWWTVFSDPVLDQLEQRALQNNPSVKAAAERLLQAQAQLGISHAGDVPQVNVGASVSNSQTSKTTTQGRAFGGRSISGNQYGLAASMAYEVDLWGKMRRINEASQAQVAVASFERDGLLLMLTSQVASNYWQLRGVKAEAAILTQSLASRREAQQLVEGRFESGIGNELDVARARLESANAAAELAEMVRQKNTLEHALAVLVAAPQVEGLPIPDTALGEPPALPPGLPARLLGQRPDLAASVAQLRALNAQVGVAQSAFYPSLQLTGNVGYASEDLRQLAQGGSRQFSIGPLSLSLPIFDGGRNQANLELSQARYREAWANHESKVMNALREVEDALSDSEQRQIQARLQDEARQAAVRAHQVAMARYQHGVSNYLDVTDAQRSSLAAERAAVQIRTQRWLASTAIARALGGGWQNTL